MSTTTTMADTSCNVQVTPPKSQEEMWGIIQRLLARIEELERLMESHLRSSRQALLQEVGFLEQQLGTNPRTAALRAKAKGLDKN